MQSNCNVRLKAEAGNATTGRASHQESNGPKLTLTAFLYLTGLSSESEMKFDEIQTKVVNERARAREQLRWAWNGRQLQKDIEMNREEDDASAQHTKLFN